MEIECVGSLKFVKYSYEIYINMLSFQDWR